MPMLGGDVFCGLGGIGDDVALFEFAVLLSNGVAPFPLTFAKTRLTAGRTGYPEQGQAFAEPRDGIVFAVETRVVASTIARVTTFASSLNPDSDSAIAARKCLRLLVYMPTQILTTAGAAPPALCKVSHPAGALRFAPDHVRA